MSKRNDEVRPLRDLAWLKMPAIVGDKLVHAKAEAWLMHALHFGMKPGQLQAILALACNVPQPHISVMLLRTVYAACVSATAQSRPFSLFDPEPVGSLSSLSVTGCFSPPPVHPPEARKSPDRPAGSPPAPERDAGTDTPGEAGRACADTTRMACASRTPGIHHPTSSADSSSGPARTIDVPEVLGRAVREVQRHRKAARDRDRTGGPKRPRRSDQLEVCPSGQ